MFPGFTPSDFDAYQPNKWKSNVFNRERLEVKQKLLALAKELQAPLVGVDGAPLAVDASVEHPALWNHKQVDAQHLFFSRNEGARKELDRIIDRGKSVASMIEDPTPLRNHVFLAVTLRQEALELAVKLHPDAKVDRQNLERKCEDHFEREKLLHLLHRLDAEFKVGIVPELVPVRSVDDEKLRSVIAQLAAPQPLGLPGTPPRLLWIGRTVPREEAVATGPVIVEAARSALGELLEVYRFIAWSRDNDFVSMREALQKEKQAQRKKGVAKNDLVRIIRGMFAGKQGVVQEIDAKGALKVLVGKVAVKVDVEDVAKS
jgi:transcription antitermination factor NusG